MNFLTIYFWTGIFVSTAWSIGLASSYIKEFETRNKNNNNLSDITVFVSNKISNCNHWIEIIIVGLFWPPVVYIWIIAKLSIQLHLHKSKLP